MAPAITTITLQQSDLVTGRMHAKLARESLRLAAHHHLYVRMGKHFREEPETAPGGEYGYAARSRRYNERKRRQFGHTRPNDRTGKLKRHIRSNSTITATQHRSRLMMRGYFELNVKGSKNRGMNDDRRKELEAISPAERGEINAQAHQFYIDEVNKPENQRQRAPKRTIQP